MQRLLKLEEAAMFCLGIYWFTQLYYAWWVFPLLLLLPDASMIGYLLGNKVGAFLYNLFHHKGVALLVWIIGVYFKLEVLQLIGLILWSHSCMDRLFGYGLKYPQGFAFTHLGKIGKEK